MESSPTNLRKRVQGSGFTGEGWQAVGGRAAKPGVGHCQARPAISVPITTEVSQMLLDLEPPSVAAGPIYTVAATRDVSQAMDRGARFGGQDALSRQPQFPWLGLSADGDHKSGEPR